MSLVRIPERGILAAHKLVERVHPLKEKREPFKPIVDWHLDPNLIKILQTENVAIGSIIGAGHMPIGFTPDQLREVGLEQNSVETITPEQITRLHELKKEIGKDAPFRFIDTRKNIERQEAAIYQDLEQIYLKGKTTGADRVLFSVCAISAGYDLNYANALLSLMEKYGTKNFVFSIFLPFTIEGVTNYSVSGQGVNPKYWVDQWIKLQDKAKELPGSIFIHEPTIRSDFPGEVTPPATVDDVHNRHKGGSSVYSDVNRMLTFQALAAATDKKGKVDVKKVNGVFSEASMKSKALLGGGPEIIAMLLYAGVPLRKLHFIYEGLTEYRRFGKTRLLLKYYKDFLPLLDKWEKDGTITQMWGQQLRRTRPYSH